MSQENATNEAGTVLSENVMKVRGRRRGEEETEVTVY